MTFKALAIATALVFNAGLSLASDLPADPWSAASPELSETLMRLARQAEATGQDHNAAALYQRAHVLDPSNSRPLTAWGNLASRIGAAEQAIEIFRSAIAVDATDVQARRGLAGAFLEGDQPEEALGLFDGLLADDPEDFRAWNGRGVALDMLNRHAEAQQAYAAGLDLAPDHPSLAENLDLSLTVSGRSDAPAAAGNLALVTAPPGGGSDQGGMAALEHLKLGGRN